MVRPVVKPSAFSRDHCVGPVYRPVMPAASDVQLRADAREGVLCRALVDLSDGLAADFDVPELLHRLTGHTRALLGDAAVGILLRGRDDHLGVAAASSSDMRAVELLAVQADDGPCVAAVGSGQTVVIDDLTGETRWPGWTTRALAAGYRSVFAVPLRLRDQVPGVLTAVGTSADQLTTADHTIVKALADVATVTLLTSLRLEQAGTLAGQLEYALHARVVIEQAKGVVAAILGLTMDEAFDRLRDSSRATNTKVSVLASAVATGQLGADELTTGTPSQLSRS